VLSVERYNVVLAASGPLIPDEMDSRNYDQVLLFAERIPDFRLQLREEANLPWIAGAIGPKIMARVSKLQGLTAGQHAAIDPEKALKHETPDDLLIAHLALSTPTRFERKLRNIRAIYEDAGIDLSRPEQSWENYAEAWHWRRWATIADPGAEFQRNVTSPDSIARLRGRGVIRSAREMLAG
jgi:hypothetical protein